MHRLTYDKSLNKWIEVGSPGYTVDLISSPSTVYRLLSLFQVGEFFWVVHQIGEESHEFCSSAVESMIGVPPDEFSMQELQSCIHPEDRQHILPIQERISYLLENKHGKFDDRKFQFDYRVETRAGNYKRLLHQISRFPKLDSEEEVRFLSVFTDISHIKQSTASRLSILSANQAEKSVSIGERKNPGLSCRELAVLKCLTAGLNSGEIAKKLFISVETVKNHRKSILKKTGARSTFHLIKTATQSGWL